MAPSKLAFGLLAICLLAGCAAAEGTDKMDVQAFANEQTAKVANVQAVAPTSVSTLLDQISISLNNIAGAWWEIEWASQQSQWDNLVQLANNAVLQILQVLPSIPEVGGLEWGSPNPNADLASVAVAICDQVASLKSYAETTYNVLLTITSMTACQQIPGNAPTPAPAPAPAAARRLLA